MIRWFPGPQDIYPAIKVQSRQGYYPYVQNSQQLHRWIGWAQSLAESYPLQAGIFVDNWRGHVNYWDLTDWQKRRVWPDWEPGDWMQRNLERAEAYLLAILSRYGQEVMLNGDSRRRGPRLFESLGKWISMADVRASARPGDTVLVKGVIQGPVGLSDTWGTTYSPYGGYPPGTSFRDVFNELLGIAEERDLGVALGYQMSPPRGGSKLGWHSFSDPATWDSL